MQQIRKAACIGAGVIGAGWVARLLYNGIDVAVCDPDPQARRKVEAVCANADRAMKRLTTAPALDPGSLTITRTINDAVQDSGLVVEAVPERLDIKRSVYAKIEAAASSDTLIASSTSGILPSELQADMRHPHRLLVAHPFNPVYLLPLVELVGGKETSPDTIERAREFYTSIGMRPLHIKKEIEAFVADRFLEAVWREALWLVKDGIASTEEIDDAIRFGFGLRWAQMGLFETYRIAGGEAGMEHFLEQFGPCLKWPWTKLMDVPELDDELVALIAGQSDAQSGKYSIRDLERIRDDNLVAIIRALKETGWGAGKTLGDYERKLLESGTARSREHGISSLPLTLERLVPGDLESPMAEAFCLQCFADAREVFLRDSGVGQENGSLAGHFAAAETRIRHVEEISAAESVSVTTHLVSVNSEAVRLFHRLERQQGGLLATCEHLLVHVDAATGATSQPAPHVLDKLNAIAKTHARHSRPHAADQPEG